MFWAVGISVGVSLIVAMSGEQKGIKSRKRLKILVEFSGRSWWTEQPLREGGGRDPGKDTAGSPHRGVWACPLLPPRGDHVVPQAGPATGKQTTQESTKVHPLPPEDLERESDSPSCTHHRVRPPRRHLIHSVDQSSPKVKAAKTPIPDPGTSCSSLGRPLWVSHRIFWNVSELLGEGGAAAAGPRTPARDPDSGVSAPAG